MEDDTQIGEDMKDLGRGGRHTRVFVSNSVLTPALVTFTRNLAALMPSALPLWQYLHGATFTIDDRDGIFANAWIDHPSTDPVLGPCAADGTHELLNNMLIYNGQVLLNGRNF